MVPGIEQHQYWLWTSWNKDYINYNKKLQVVSYDDCLNGNTDYFLVHTFSVFEGLRNELTNKKKIVKLSCLKTLGCWSLGKMLQKILLIIIQCYLSFIYLSLWV